MIINDTISESRLLARYQAGERRFVGLNVEQDGSHSLECAVLDEIQLIDCFVAVSFRRASLRGAVLRANVKTCNFTGADLTSADFRTAALDATTFKEAKMEGADFTDAYIQDYDLKTGEQPDW